MDTDSRKIQIIESVLKTEDDETLSQIEQVIQESQKPEKKFSAHDFVGTLSKEDAALIEQAIEEGCEQIHPDDWK
jgi:hypothetical protein